MVVVASDLEVVERGSAKDEGQQLASGPGDGCVSIWGRLDGLDLDVGAMGVDAKRRAVRGNEDPAAIDGLIGVSMIRPATWQPPQSRCDPHTATIGVRVGRS